MIPEFERPRITEIQVRVDCNGCVQKIKKALHGINGIYDLYIDLPQQKLTVIGWADPEKIIKAIKKARKSATICSIVEPTEPADPPTEPPPEGSTPAPATDASNHPPTDFSPTEAPARPAEHFKDSPTPDMATTEATTSHPVPPSGPKVIEEVHVIHRYPPDPPEYRYGNSYSYSPGEYWNNNPNAYVGHRNNYPSSYDGHWNNYPNSRFRHEPQPLQSAHVTHSYNSYTPSPYISEYEHVQSQPQHTHYSRREHYSEDYHNSGNGGNGYGNVSSMFSDENPNACRIV